MGRHWCNAAWRVSVVLLVVGVLVPPAAAATGKASRFPAALVGCWKRHVGALPVGTPAGVWEIEIGKNGRLDAYTPGSRCGVVAGDFSATLSAVGNRLTIGVVPVCQNKGAYRWKVSGTSLTLKLIADKACPPRVGLFVGVWTKT